MRYGHDRVHARKIVAVLAVALTGGGLAALALTTQSNPPASEPVPYVELKETLPLDAPRLDDALTVAVPSPVWKDSAVPDAELQALVGPGPAPLLEPIESEPAAQFLHGNAADSEALLASALPTLDAPQYAFLEPADYSGAVARFGQYAPSLATATAAGGGSRRRSGGSAGGGGGGGGGGAGGSPGSGSGSRSPASSSTARAGNGTERIGLARLTLDPGVEFAPTVSGFISEIDPSNPAAAALAAAGSPSQLTDSLAVGGQGVDLSTVSQQLNQGSGSNPLALSSSNGGGGGGSAPQVVATPEPASLLLFGSGLAVTAWRFRRQSKKRERG